MKQLWKYRVEAFGLLGVFAAVAFATSLIDQIR